MPRMSIQLASSPNLPTGVAYGKDKPEGASTPAGVTRLAYAGQLVEVSFTVALSS